MSVFASEPMSFEKENVEPVEKNEQQVNNT